MRLSNGFRDIVSGALTAGPNCWSMATPAHDQTGAPQALHAQGGSVYGAQLYEQDIILGSGFIATFNGVRLALRRHDQRSGCAAAYRRPASAHARRNQPQATGNGR